MPLPFLAASSKAAFSAARQLAAGTVGRTRPVVASLEDRISTWYSLGKGDHRGTTWKGGRPGRPTTSAGQALSGDAQKAAYIQALASMGLSTETAIRMDRDRHPDAPPSKRTRGWRPTWSALQRNRGLEKGQKGAGARVASPVYTAKVADATSTAPQQGAGTGVARPTVYTAPDAARASSGGSWLRAVLSLKKPVCKESAYARYVESLASRGLSIEVATRIDRAVYRKGADMLGSYGGSHGGGAKKRKDRKPQAGDASSPLRGSAGADALKG